jgi:hypothetical protein
MRKNIFEGMDLSKTRGIPFESFEEAWDTYYQAVYGDKAIGKEDYRKEYRAFMAGSLSTLNIVSVKVNRRRREPDMVTVFRESIFSTLNDALYLAGFERIPTGVWQDDNSKKVP